MTNSIDDQYLYRQLVLEKGSLLIDEDRQAENDIKKENLNYDLLLSRLLFDGGYYSKTLANLNKINIESFDKNSDYEIEYYYRIARVSQKMIENNEDKISLFSKVLDIENTSNLYYHPMSALQIGLEYEIMGDKKNAVIFFNKVFYYEDYNYENGIKKSAKAGINRLQN